MTLIKHMSKKTKNKLEEEIALLALAGKDIKVYDPFKPTEYLWIASMYGHISIVKLLLEVGCYKLCYLNRALFEAMYNKHKNVAELLIKYGATWEDF